MNLGDVFREEWAAVVAILVSTLGDLTLAEDAAQDAFARAAQTWPDTGVPTSPRAWLVTTARHRAIDIVRRERTLATKTELLALDLREDTVPDTSSTFPDERLQLIFMCCHPALSIEAQVALTLRSVGGLSTERIAAAFLVPEATMAKRLVRAKHKIVAAGVPFRIPSADVLDERIDAVLAVVYLIFNEGWSRHDGLAGEAIWLGRALAELLPDHPEVHGLRAMMLASDARRDARLVDGETVLLADQDRHRWDHAQLADAVAVFQRALALGGSGPYVLHAAIAIAHTREPRDWAHIAVLYGELSRRTGSPVVELNRAVAVAEVEGPAAALDLVDRIELPAYRYLHSTRAELLHRLDRTAEALASYSRALALTDDPVERRQFERRIAEIESTR